MKDELGIEICGENCKDDIIPATGDCVKCGQEKCQENCKCFVPKRKALVARIRELQKDKDYLERVAKYHVDLGGASLAHLFDDYSELFKVLTKLLEKKSFELGELQARVQLAEHKEICVKENAEKLDAKESEAQNER